MLTSPAGHEAKAEARKSEAENEAEAQKVFRGQGPRPQYEDEARHVRTTQCVWAWRLRYWRSEHNFQWATNRPTQQKWMLMVILWILINVMCTVNIRGHEANFYEARCHEAEAKKSEAEAEWFGLEALTSLAVAQSFSGGVVIRQYLWFCR